MKAETYWISRVPGAGRLAIMPRPQGGSCLQDEMRSLKEQGVDMLVSLLTEEEIRQSGLEDEEAAARAAGIIFVWHPIPDMSVPTDDKKTLDLAEDICGWLAGQSERQGQSGGRATGVAVHCFGGIGRSGLLLACVLMKLGKTADAAVKMISQARGFNVPQTPEQAEWIERMEGEAGTRG